MLVFDIETNGLLDHLTHIKCLNILDAVTGEESRYTDHEFYEQPWPDVFGDGQLHILQGERTPRAGTVADGLRALANASDICGQNIIGFDLPAIRMLYPEWSSHARVWDLLVMARVMYTNIYELDEQALRRGKLPAAFVDRKLNGTHKLESWGLRVGGELKGDFVPSHYGQTWNDYSFSRECDDYCAQDNKTALSILKHFLAKDYSDQCFQLEHRTAEILFRQEKHGWFFDKAHAEKLTGQLQAEKAELEEAAATVFKPWYRKIKPMEGRNHKVNGTVKGADWYKIEYITFNPGSRDHIADRLMAVHGWRPTEFTPKGKPKIDETILETLPYPEAKVLAQYFTTTKRLAQLADGKQSWLKALKPDGRIHGRVNGNGAVTGRMTHSNPNVANADKWPPMRKCWTVPHGYKLVGVDADGLELRMLAERMAKYDNGAYIEIVVNGRKEEGTDVHSMNMKALGLNDRDSAKTWIYAFLYGAGNYKLGTVVYNDFPEEKKARFNEAYSGKKRDRALTELGKRSRDRMAAGFPALAKLIERVKKFSAKYGYLKGLDGRLIHVRSQHAALNSQLQSDGAVVMKQALVLLDQDLQTSYTPGEEFEFVGNIHDELQIEAKEEIAHDVAERASSAITNAGIVLGLRCPLAGGADIGDSWAETH